MKVREILLKVELVGDAVSVDDLRELVDNFHDSILCTTLHSETTRDATDDEVEEANG